MHSHIQVVHFNFSRLFKYLHKNFVYLKVFEFQRRIFTSISPRDAENAAAHHTALLLVQNHLGLDHTAAHILHVRVRAVQRGIQVENNGRRAIASGRQRSRRRLFPRHCSQLSHDLRKSDW